MAAHMAVMQLPGTLQWVRCQNFLYGSPRARRSSVSTVLKTFLLEA